MLENKSIVVTGALGYLGSSTCKKLSKYGATVYGLDIRPQDGPFKVLKVDLLSVDAIEQVCKELKVNALVNIAGGFSIDETPYGPCDKNWKKMFELNVLTLKNTLKVIVPKLIEKKAGNIINVGAASALKGSPKLSSYICAKSAVMRITETMAEELKSLNIQVNAISPSIIDTPFNRAEMPDADPKLWTKPEEIAEVISFLCSEKSSCISGAIIPV